MKQAKYRVEAFIIPVGNDCYSECSLTKTDDAKISDKLKDAEVNNTTTNHVSDWVKNESHNTTGETNNTLSTEEENMQNLQNFLTLKNVVQSNNMLNKTKEDVWNDLDPCFCLLKSKCQQLYGLKGLLCPSSSLMKISTLTSIDENNEESDEKLTDLCYHGCRNGCSAVVQAPQEVSEEVFKENWLQKLETVKQKETALKNKEIILQNRERALFKREREVRIMERHLKNKLKQVDLRLEQSKCLQGTLKLCDENSESSSSMESKGLPNREIIANKHMTESLCNAITSKFSLCGEDPKKKPVFSNHEQKLDKNTDNIMYKELQEEKSSTCGSNCSSDNNIPDEKRSKQRGNVRSLTTSKSSCSKSYSSGNGKAKKVCKVYYEDLDTTLSADVGDSSFVQTAQKFNPELYRKPYAFTRSASERHIKRTSNRNSINLETHSLAIGNVDSRFPVGIEQNKVLRRFTENISVSQDKNTTFQHYGLIDQNVESASKSDKIENDLRDEKKYSYLNLETGGKINIKHKVGKNLKDRPTSWNEGTNEWLQKKRQAYNMTAKRMPTEDFEDKENFKCNNKDKSQKIFKKKDIKNKIFTIFR